MNNKKKFLVILLALLLALAVSLIMHPKQTKKEKSLENNQTEETIIDISSESLNKNEEIEEIKENSQEENSTTENKITNKKIINKINESKKVDSKKEEAPIFKKLEVKEETAKIEETGISFEDPGIINDNGVIVVTRDFKLKSPRKYSFKDFGVLAEPPVR